MDFFETIKIRHNIKLNEQQKQAVLHKEGPALVLAGPGSGKTTVITARAACLIQNSGVRPDNILTLTFNKAAQLEMERRFQRLYGNEINGKVHFSTLHSFCNNVVRKYEALKGQRLKRIEGNDNDINKKQLLKTLYLEINNSKINDDELESLINEIGFVKNKMIKNIDGGIFSTNKFSQVFKAYEEYKRKNLYIDFDDMLTYAYSILIKCPEILNYYKNKYTYIQVDEGQDLSKIQFEVLNLLIKGNNNFFIVADDDQSIYGFRGAEPQYILDIRKQFSNCSIYNLETNYRSSKNIVELSSKFIKLNENRFDKNHTTFNKEKCDPIIINAKNEHEQLKIIIDKVKETLSRREDKEIAILYRNNLSSIIIADAFLRQQIPFKIKQNSLLFFKHWLVKDVVAFLMFALDQHDKEAFSKIYYRMNRYISKTMIECSINADNSGMSVIDCIINNADLKQFQINALQLLKVEFNSLSRMKPWEALEYIKNDFNYLESVKGYCELVGLSFEYLNRLFGILQGLSVGCQTIASFLVRLQELEQIFDGTIAVDANKKSSITLSTLHSSKGLEYDCVFMIDLINSEIPGEKALEQNSEGKNKAMLEEERRLFYVGMTRARNTLYLIYPMQINNEIAMRSIFINEVLYFLKKDIIDGIGEGSIVMHTKFGRGAVAEINESSADNQTIKIKFFSGEYKTFNLQICLENKLLSFD
ncbi:ATP-dependent helicase [Ruminiclostridium herbifermentans]|uniref:DNA 3'-5' helicase n=1 Tax=Ruminiclostridium herbifermentans TaxID=2488810 RepID=A0A4U7JIC1_9FIRM|nr:ATP-dependent helicase [Ruminiclostridium herbifermentans]QNU65405.1 ATP-dependent helicase [Ruminiclostridium herbifermentans]